MVLLKEKYEVAQVAALLVFRLGNVGGYELRVIVYLIFLLKPMTCASEKLFC
jgi:hypothetical protein